MTPGYIQIFMFRFRLKPWHMAKISACFIPQKISEQICLFWSFSVNQYVTNEFTSSAARRMGLDFDEVIFVNVP